MPFMAVTLLMLSQQPAVVQEPAVAQRPAVAQSSAASSNPARLTAMTNRVEQPVELGQVKWRRDFDAGLAEAKRTGKPALLLFQEVPG